MPIKDWSETANSNTTVDGVNIAEGCAPSGINNGMRNMMADTRAAVAGARVDVASATTTDLGAEASNYIRITGTTTITGFGTVSAGIKKDVLFSGILTLTHNATSLILPGAANIPTAAGDMLIAISEGSGNWRVEDYQPASGKPVVPSYTVGQIPGTATNDNASAGNVGEYVSSAVAQGSAVSLTTNIAANITSISLTAGDWDVEGVIFFNPNVATVTTVLAGGVSATSATLPTPGAEGYAQWVGNLTGASVPSLTACSKRISLASPATIYLVAFATFTANTNAAYGTIRARRVR